MRRFPPEPLRQHENWNLQTWTDRARGEYRRPLPWRSAIFRRRQAAYALIGGRPKIRRRKLADYKRGVRTLRTLPYGFWLSCSIYAAVTIFGFGHKGKKP